MRLSLAAASLVVIAACSQSEPSSEPALETSGSTMSDSQVPESAASEIERPTTWQELLGREREEANARIAYGPGEHQYGELWLPEGEGPFALVIMVHGGCWRAEIPGTILQDQLNADLRRRGIAVWNITYPRVGHETGGYPGTFQSVAAAVDHVRVLAGEHRLDLTRTAIVGHSAGGHLAAWAASRGQLGHGQIAGLNGEAFVPGALITLAGINDLEHYSAEGPGRCGEPDIVNALIGAESRSADPYGDTSPARLLPFGVEQVIISGDVDPIVPAAFGVAYAERAQAAGDTVTEITVPNSGHFELIDPTAPAWDVIVTELDRVLE